MSTSTEILEHRRSLSDADLDATALADLRHWYSLSYHERQWNTLHTKDITRQVYLERGRGERWDELVAIVKGEKK